MNVMRSKIIAIFFGVAACSWVPHAACHYYRLETASAFVVGEFPFSPVDSLIAIGIYTILIAANCCAIVFRSVRPWAAGASGLLHIAIGMLHLWRLIHPFRFEVFGYMWSLGASLRETLIVLPFGLACVVVAIAERRVEVERR